MVTDAGLLIRDNNSTNGTTVVSPDTDVPLPTPKERNLEYMKKALAKAASEESWGGNAGVFKAANGEHMVAAALNFRINSKTGEIAAFTNYGHPAYTENEDLAECTFRIVNGGHKIVQTFQSDELSDNAKGVLAASVEEWNREKTAHTP